MNQALWISAGNNSVTLHPPLLSLMEPGGNAENAKLVSKAKQVQWGGWPTTSQGKKAQLVKKHKGEAYFKRCHFVESSICTPRFDP